MNLTRRGHVTYVEAQANTRAAIRERGLERRRTHRFVVRDRRSGFERRRSRSRTTPGAAYESSLVYLRDHPAALIGLLALANLLSVLDFVLTRILLRLGVQEGNPFMDYLFHSSPVQAAVVKVGIIAAASLGIWALRRQRAALVAALFLVGAFGAVVLYELLGLARLM